MKRRLVIYLDETWPARPSAPWVLLDDRDRVLESGSSEPRHWPAAHLCEAVLGGTQCAGLQVRLPRSGRREQDSLLRYALEERLIGDVEQQHLTVVDRRPATDGIQITVLVTARSRLRALLAQLQAISRPPSRMVSELQASPVEPDAWTLCIGPGGHWILRMDAQPALALDAASAADTIAMLLQQARGSGEAPSSLTIRAAHGIPTPDTALLHATTGLKLNVGPEYPWWASMHGSDDLLHDEFHPGGARSGPLASMRAPALVAFGTACLFLAAGAAEVVWQKQQLAELEDRMQRIFVTAVPNTPAIAPALQLQRTLDEVRGRHGQLRSDDFLSLLERLTEAAGRNVRHTLRRVTFEGRSLTLGFDPASSGQGEPIAADLEGLGYTVRMERDPAPTLTLTRRNTP